MLSVILSFLLLVVVIVGLLLMLFPLVQKQVFLLINMTPQIIDWTEGHHSAVS